MTVGSSVALGRVRTVRTAADGSALLDQLPTAAGVAWLRGADGLVGWGEAARLTASGPGRFAEALKWWGRQVAGCDVEDDVGLPGCGPLAFGSFAFADRPGTSVLVVPRVVLGRRDGASWVTTVSAGDEPAPSPAVAAPSAVHPPGRLAWVDGGQPITAWREAVAEAIRRMRSGELDKAVLALDLHVRAEREIDARWLLRRLATAYPECFSFAVEGLVGATPELLVRRTAGRVESLVLAGTVPRGGNAAQDDRMLRWLRDSAKENAEHQMAVDSTVDRLRPLCTDPTTSGPTVLRLANVAHLATTVSAEAPESTALELAAALHPTAAVAGTPTSAALDLIAELETFDRGRYAGPVGWVDARGDGEWCIALRCGELAGDRARLFAGCGIVADSDPDAEVAEWLAKLQPMRDALGS